VAAERLVEHPRAGRHLALVALFALQALGGAPELFVQSAVLSAAFALFARGKAGSWRRLVAAASALGLALAISTVQLLPSATRPLPAKCSGGASTSGSRPSSWRSWRHRFASLSAGSRCSSAPSRSRWVATLRSFLFSTSALHGSSPRFDRHSRFSSPFIFLWQ